MRRAERRTAAWSLALVLGAGPAFAASPVFGPPAAVNGNAAVDTGNDGTPRIVTDGHGTWITTWAATAAPGGDSDVVAARSTDLGISWSAPVAVNAAAAADDAVFDFAPTLATDGAGVWIAVWVATNGPDTDLFTARSLNGGVSWSTPLPLYADAATDAGNDDRPQIVSDATGTWIVAWDSSGRLGSDRDILIARSTDGGLTWTPPAALASNAATDRGTDQRPQLATDGSGRWIVVWASSDTLGNTKGKDFDVLLARSEDGGLTWTPAHPLNGTAATDTALDDRPQLATDGAGTWVVAWVSDDTLGNTIGTDLDVLTARSTDGGATWTAPAALNGNAASDGGEDGAPGLTTDRHGTWVAVWESNDSLAGTLGADHDVLMAHSVDGGAHWSAPHALEPTATDDERRDVAPQVATDGGGVWNTVWSAAGGPLGADSDVMRAGGRERCGNGTVDPGEQCDDGNTRGGDACPAGCEFPPPATPTATATPPPGGSPGALPTFTPGGGPSSDPSPEATPGEEASGTAAPSVTPSATAEASSPTVDPAATPTATGAGPATPAATGAPPTGPAPGATPTIAGSPGFAGGLTGGARAKAAVGCQRAILKSGAQLVGKRLTTLGSCTRGVHRCIQTKPDDPGCLGKAAARCRSGLVGLATLDAKSAASLRLRCGGALAIDDVLQPAGLGHAGGPCGTNAAASLADVVDCLVGEHACRGGTLVELLQPRAKELMRLPGTAAATLDTVLCLPDHGGDGSTLGDPAGLGKAVDVCTGAVVKAGTSLVRKRLGRLARCADALFTCVQLAPDDGACLAKARKRCDTATAASATDERTLTKTVAKRCGESVMAYATLRAAAAANLDALEDACARVGVPELESLADYQQCVLRAETCRVEGMLRVQMPRITELLRVVGRSFGSDYCGG